MSSQSTGLMEMKLSVPSRALAPRTLGALTALWALTAQLAAAELPRLPKGLDPWKQSYAEQRKLPDLPAAYVSLAPEDLNDGLSVGALNVPGAKEAVGALVAENRAGKYQNLDSLLLWKDGKLLFEMYARRGRVDGPHYVMSITKTLTSVALARAMQLGFVQLADLDKAVVDFMPEIDRAAIQPGVETITLRDALFMKSGLRFEEKRIDWKLGAKYKGQQFFQKLFELTAPVTPASKTFKYIATDPSMVMMVIDLRTPGPVQDFLARELAAKFDATYRWEDQGCGLPKCGAGSNWTSRDLMKIGVTLLQGGKWQGEQLLSAEYVKLILDQTKGDGYFYYFHNRDKLGDDGKIDFISGIGAGGQYLSLFPDLNLVFVATAHNQGALELPLQAALTHLIPLFTN